MTTAPEVDELYSDQRYSHEIVFWQNKNFGPRPTCLHLFIALKSEMCVWKKNQLINGYLCFYWLKYDDS